MRLPVSGDFASNIRENDVKKPVIWILIADGGRAKIYQAAGKGRIEEKAEMAVAHPPTRELVSDRPGRTFDSAGPRRHAKEAPTDAHEKAETAFLRSIARKLDVSFRRKEFDRLIVVAAPRALGTLRNIFPGPLMNAVDREISHDLTGFSTPALETYLREHGVIRRPAENDAVR